MSELTPRQTVAELDKYVVGQPNAKRAVAVALRNRHRRRLVDERTRADITPKNILMIGPTGVGKTEIARQVAKLARAPMIKVEATKFTEVGYVGRDVESIIHELADAAVNMVHSERMSEAQGKAEGLAADRILEYLCQQLPAGSSRKGKNRRQAPSKLVVQAVLSGLGVDATEERGESRTPPSASASEGARRRRMSQLLADHQLEDTTIEIELPADPEDYDSMLPCPVGMSPDEFVQSLKGDASAVPPPAGKRVRRVSVKEARRILTREEAEKLVDWDDVVDEGVKRAEETGIVFVDELDKVIGPRVEMGADVSGAGVQRDLLPIVEGTTVMTRYGPVRTDYVLFIGAGSFHSHKPTELIPELQGRFPLRVELEPLSHADLERILTEPENSLVKQYQALLATEGIRLSFAPDGIAELASVAESLNLSLQNIGARRLHTVFEKVLEDLSFNAPDEQNSEVVVDRPYVQSRLAILLKNEDLSRYIL